MKRSVSIVFILLLLLNTVGYYGLLVGWQYQNDIQMVRRLDTIDYTNAQTVTIKIPVAIPYLHDNPEFERVDGKFEHNGEFYRLLKQRYSQDTLTMICVRDHENKLIHKALADYVQSFTDSPGDHQGHSKLLQNFSKEYVHLPLAMHAVSQGWQADVVKASPQRNLVATYIPSINHPPEQA